MTIAIDPNTGRAAGPARAVTTDEVSLAGYASPDGKWIPYITPSGDSIKIVPFTGGTARFVAKAPGGSASPPNWHPDGKSLVFASPWRGAKSIWYRVPATGGTPVRTEHAPFFGALHVHRDRERTARHVELRDSTERLVSTLDVPPGMQDWVLDHAPAAIGIMNTQRYVSQIYSVETGAHRVIDNWADGWTSDGKNFVVELTDPGPDGSAEQSISVAVQDASGKIISRTPLGVDAGNCCGWSGVVGTALTFGRRSNNVLLIADASSGRVRQLAGEQVLPDRTWALPLIGRGGYGFSDGDRFLFTTLTEQAIEVRAGKTDGTSTLLRAFSTRDSTWQPKHLDGGHAIAVAGERVAWTDRTRDSVAVWTARGPTGAPRRVAAFPSPICTGDGRGRCHTELIWSGRGDALALATMDDHPLVAVMRVRADGALDGSPTMLQTGVRMPWCVRWVDDDRALVMIAARDRSTEDVVVVPVRGGSAPRVLGPASGEWMWVSPNGKEILYPEVVTTGSSIWRLDFVPTNAAASTGKTKP